MILSDLSIEQLCSSKHNYQATIGIPGADNRVTTPIDGPMIAPYNRECVRYLEDGQRVISYGQSSFGYDVRLANKFQLFTNINNGVIDPKNPCEKTMVEFEGDSVLMPPNSYILGHTQEVFNIPRDIMVVCVGKSTYARCGAIVNTTPIEPEFQGQVVIEISNATNSPMKIYANEGIAQFMFFLGEQPCGTSYGDRNGKYQGQRGLTLARI